MATTDTNVVVGAGIPYIATVGTALPTITGTLAGSVTWGASWNQIGWSEDQFKIKIEEKFDDFRPAGEVADVLSNLATRAVSGSFQLAESDADAFHTALASSTLSAAIVSDGGATSPTYWALAIQTRLMVYHLKKVRFTIGSEMTLEDTKRTIIPVSFQAFQYMSDTAGQRLYRFWERT